MNTILSFEEAYELLDQATTKEDIRAVINRISVGDGDAVSVLFSGAHSLTMGSGKAQLGTVDLANALAANAEGVRVMGNTDMGRFMITEKDAPDANYKLIKALNRVFAGDTEEINAFMYGRYENGVLLEPGLWDDASARFVNNAKGDVLTFTGNANIDRIFARTELPILLENTNVKSIDGIPRELLAALPKTNGIPVEAFEAIRTMSALRTARLGIPVSAEGLPIAERGRVTIEAREFLAGLEGLTHKPVDPSLKFEKLGVHFDIEMARTHMQGLQVLQKMEIDLTPLLERPSDAKIANFLLGSLNRLGILTDALDVFRLGYVGLEAKQAYDQGDREKGDTLLSKWALENGGAILGGRLGAALGLALFGGATGGLGLVVGMGLGLLGAHLGSTYGDEAFAIVADGLADLQAWTLAKMRGLFGDAEQHVSPIVLDLDGNGIDTLALSDWQIHFDYADDGFAERTGWVGARDGLLVRDLNANGLIDSGKELFGNYTLLADGRRASHGFEALATLDEDGNGVLNRNDSTWSSLAVWMDTNSSATLEPGEMHSLSSLQIESLELSYHRENIIDQQGNIHVEIGSYTRDGASRYAMHDVWFAIDPAHSLNRESAATTPWLERIPNLLGSGVVQDLRQVVGNDASGRLLMLLQKWIQAADQERSLLLNEIIFAWTGVTPTTRSSIATLEPSDQQKLSVLERFLGKEFLAGAAYRNPSAAGLALLDQTFEELKSSVAISLIAQNELIILLNSTQKLTDSHTGAVSLDASQSAGWIERCFDPLRDRRRLHDLGRAMKLLPDQGEALAAGLRHAMRSTSNQWLLSAMILDHSSLQAGSAAPDRITDTSADEFLFGLDGEDELISTSGRDIHLGGKGNDVITSGAGDDLFLYSRADGHDQISDRDENPANLDTIQLFELNPSDLTGVYRHSNSLQLMFGHGDSLTLLQYLADPSYRIEQVRFADGSQWGHKELVERIMLGGATSGNDNMIGYNDSHNRIAGLDGDDILIGAILNDLIRGDNGHDYILGRAGDDLLEGGAGDDRLKGESGRDTLIGGSGNDWLEGGEGDDIYHFSRGDGSDQISDHDENPANHDTLQLVDLRPNDLIGVFRCGHDSRLVFNNGDSLLLLQYFGSPSERIEQVRFADGSLWSHGELLERIWLGGATPGNDYLIGHNDSVNRIDGLDGDDYLAGGVLNDLLRGNNGQDHLLGRAGDDLLEGGAGDDQLKAEAGRDTLVGGSGNDWLDGGEGDDLYQFSRGDGQDLISDGDDNPANLDTVQLLNLNASDLQSVQRYGHDLQLSFSSGDLLSVSQYFAASRFRIEQIRFADGTHWGHGDLLERVTLAGATAGHDVVIGYNDISNRIDGLDGDDYLAGGILNDLLRGGNGQDQLLGRGGDDLLEGGAGDDQLKGEAGRDTLVGGSGNDWLDGGEGDDLYHFSRGDGQDLISDGDDNPANLDTVQLLNLNASDLQAVQRYGHDLQLSFSSGDLLSVSQYFAASRFRIEQIHFADGTRWGHGELLERVTLAGATAGHDVVIGYNDISNRIDGLDGDDYLAGGVLNDLLRGNNGQDHLLGRAGDDLLEGGAGDDQLKGEAGRDSLHGGLGHDLLDGGEGDDQLSGDAGNDILLGGPGRDLLIGGVGADLYLLARGDGQDRLRDLDPSTTTIDEVLFNDQASTQVTGVLRSLNDLQLSMASGDSLTVLDYFASISNRIEQFRFADSQLWSHSQLLERLRIAGATAGNDTLGGYNDTPNRIDGLEGQDVLIGGALSDSLKGSHGQDVLQGRGGDDLLDGGFGDDNLWGEAGKDTLTGGPGNDLLDGGIGADVYRLARGDGHDRIRDSDSSSANLDQVQFSDLSTSQVSGVVRRSNDLQLTFTSGDSLTVLAYFSSTANRIEQFRFADARTWSHADLIARLTLTT